MTLNDKLEAFFKAHEREWIDGKRLAEIAGGYAWRSRVSNLRTQRGMNIENRQRTIREHDFTCPATLAWDVPGACNCLRERRFVKSEYRYLPAPKTLLDIAS